MPKACECSHGIAKRWPKPTHRNQKRYIIDIKNKSGQNETIAASVGRSQEVKHGQNVIGASDRHNRTAKCQWGRCLGVRRSAYRLGSSIRPTVESRVRSKLQAGHRIMNGQAKGKAQCQQQHNNNKNQARSSRKCPARRCSTRSCSVNSWFQRFRWIQIVYKYASMPRIEDASLSTWVWQGEAVDFIPFSQIDNFI